MHALIRTYLRAACKHRLAGGKVQDRRNQPVHFEVRIALQKPQHPRRFLAEYKSRSEDWIASDVVHRPAAIFHHVANVPGIAVEKTEIAPHRTQIANRSRPNQIPGSQPLRMRPNHKCLADLHTGAVPRRHQRPRLRHRHADRLLAQHVLARFRRSNRPRHMQMIRQWNVHRLDFRILQQFFVRSIRARNPQLPCRILGLPQIPRRDCRHRAPFSLLHRGNHFLGSNLRGTQHSPSHLVRHPRLLSFGPLNYRAEISGVHILVCTAFSPGSPRGAIYEQECSEGKSRREVQQDEAQRGASFLRNPRTFSAACYRWDPAAQTRIFHARPTQPATDPIPPRSRWP